MKDFYDRNADFKRYVDRYCKTHGLTVEEALEHELVKQVAAQYREKEEARVSDGEFIAVHEVVSRVKK